MKSMVISESEKKDMGEVSAIDDKPKYPYGLKLHLCENCYEKLEFKDIPKLGQKFMMLAEVEVTDIQQNKNKDDRMNISMGLQITQMELKPAEKEKKDVAQALYGDGE